MIVYMQQCTYDSKLQILYINAHDVATQPSLVQQLDSSQLKSCKKLMFLWEKKRGFLYTGRFASKWHLLHIVLNSNMFFHGFSMGFPWVSHGFSWSFDGAPYGSRLLLESIIWDDRVLAGGILLVTRGWKNEGFGQVNGFMIWYKVVPPQWCLLVYKP